MGGCNTDTNVRDNPDPGRRMDFELDDDQEALRAAARDLLDDLSSPTHVRAAVDAGDGFDRKLWAAMVEQGWTGVAVPEGAGGLGLGWVEAAILAEEAGAHVAPAPIVQHLIATASVTSGADVLTAAGSGAREVVPFVPSSDGVVAIVGGELHLVAGGGAREPAMDVTREVGWFEPIGGDRLGGAPEVARHLDVGATMYAAELLGLSQHMLDVSVAYAKDRVQFDKPIGSFQAVKHRLADMLVDVEGMRSVVYYAAWCLSAAHADSSIAASTAKAWCSDAATRVLASALQVHGGIGFTWEHDTHLYLKRGQLDAMAFGDATFHRTRLAGLLRPKVEAGESVV
jgi:alkylation response protein AidB-like acyl-CoA dehydrogenase